MEPVESVEISGGTPWLVRQTCPTCRARVFFEWSVIVRQVPDVVAPRFTGPSLEPAITRVRDDWDQDDAAL